MAASVGENRGYNEEAKTPLTWPAVASVVSGGPFLAGRKITVLVLGWVVDPAVRFDSRGFGVGGSSLKCAFASIVW